MRYGVSFVNSKSDLCSAVVIAVLYVIWPYICYNGTWLYLCHSKWLNVWIWIFIFLHSLWIRWPQTPFQGSGARLHLRVFYLHFCTVGLGVAFFWWVRHVPLVAISGTTIQVPYHTLGVTTSHLKIGWRWLSFNLAAPYFKWVAVTMINSLRPGLTYCKSCSIRAPNPKT